MALDTIADYLTVARTLLQDKSAPYRYETDELVEALNMGLMEARRLRADLFLNTGVPRYSTADTGATVAFDEQYRTALLYFIVGHAHLRDEEDTQDARATTLLNTFAAKLLTITS